jgi:transposase-like protein
MSRAVLSPWRRVLERRVTDSVRLWATVESVARNERLDPDTVRDWCNQAGIVLPAPDLPIPDVPAAPTTPIERAVARVAAGESYGAAARTEGVYQSVLYRHCQRRRVVSAHPTPRRLERSVRDACVLAVRAGLSQSAAAREFGVSQSVVCLWCQDEGIHLRPTRRRAAR